MTDLNYSQSININVNFSSCVDDPKVNSVYTKEGMFQSVLGGKPLLKSFCQFKDTKVAVSWCKKSKQNLCMRDINVASH